MGTLTKELIYVGDPMCSWCYGFAAAKKKLEDQCAGRLPRPSPKARAFGFKKIALQTKFARHNAHTAVTRELFDAPPNGRPVFN